MLDLPISQPIFSHDLLNPIATSNGAVIELNVKNSSGQMHWTKIDPENPHTVFLLTITKASLVGVRNHDQATLWNFFNDFLLACNLDLQQTVLSIRQINIPPFYNAGPETVRISSVFSENLDEESVFKRYELIKKIDRNRPSIDKKIVNLSKSLLMYENAMLSFDRINIFKELFNSLSLATSWVNETLHGQALDEEIGKITGIEQSKVQEWRLFYNSIRHVDKTEDDSKKFMEDKENAFKQLIPLRIATNNMISNRLFQI